MNDVFDERQAIKMRLRQLRETEKRVIDELNAEREILLSRLHDLENGVSPKKEGRVQTRRSLGRVSAIRELIVAYLKERKVPVRAVEIQRFVEQETGKKISNMSAFMNALEPEFDRIQKLGRGLYIYEYGTGQ
ncbi:hypothetical protein NLX67_03020 [Domibacillus sp. A3M-37]|uniref:Rok-like winged helix domain-containing protein n=1 Tax=Domibacillus sp. A3M-37 TaxID=2962037 RepID=UPI0020B6FA84|nr:hypothetical protein [Domibacillus sp. A3M-37]MCP3761363.1 hypothetical protein [Domibacillus sp. A3M-37]